MQFIQISHKLYCLWLWVWKILCALILFPSLIIKNLKGFKYKLKIQLIFFEGFHTIHTVSYCPKRFSQILIEKKNLNNWFWFFFLSKLLIFYENKNSIWSHYLEISRWSSLKTMKWKDNKSNTMSIL